MHFPQPPSLYLKYHTHHFFYLSHTTARRLRLCLFLEHPSLLLQQHQRVLHGLLLSQPVAQARHCAHVVLVLRLRRAVVVDKVVHHLMLLLMLLLMLPLLLLLLVVLLLMVVVSS